MGGSGVVVVGVVVVGDVAVVVVVGVVAVCWWCFVSSCCFCWCCCSVLLSLCLLFLCVAALAHLCASVVALPSSSRCRASAAFSAIVLFIPAIAAPLALLKGIGLSIGRIIPPWEAYEVPHYMGLTRHVLLNSISSSQRCVSSASCSEAKTQHMHE